MDSLPLIDDDDDGSRMSLLPESSADIDVGPSTTVEAIRRMRRKRSRRERTRRRDRSLARLSKAGESPSPVEKTEYFDARGNRVTRYRTSPPTQFPQLPYIDQTRTADDDDVENLFQFQSSRPSPSPTSWKGFVNDEEEIQKIVSSPGKLRSMLVESGIDSVKTETAESVTEEADATTPIAKRLSYAMQSADDDDGAPDVEPLPRPAAATSVQTSPSVVPRSSLEARTTWSTPLSEPAVSRASVDAVVAPAPESKFVTALSMPAKELQRIRESFSSHSMAASDLQSQPSSTTSKAALLQQQRAGGLATSDVPAQPSLSKQVRRSSLLGVTDVQMKPSVTTASKKKPCLLYTSPSPRD